MQNKYLQIHFTHFKQYHKKMFERFNFTNDGAKFFYNVGLSFGFNGYVPRAGVWSTPWDGDLVIHGENNMPVYDPNFTKSFSQISDETAKKIADRIDTSDEKFLVLYSGGIDSTCTVAALIKNLTQKQLENITISLSFDSIVENKYFYDNFIRGKIKIHDSHEFDMRKTVLEKGYTVITADQGDALFGTELGTKMYPLIEYYFIDKTESNYYKKNISNPDVHYSEYKDMIIWYLNNCMNGRFKKYGLTSEKTSFDLIFGKIYYDRLVKNIETSNCPVNSLHDFFWWIIFNIKYIHCALRAGGVQSTGRDRSKIFSKCINWFGNQDFQSWSMANNNNGQKINGCTQGRYKIAAKDYIHELDNNDWYYWYKMKVPSKQIIVNRYREDIYEETETMFGLDENYQMIHFTDPGITEYFYEKIKSFDV